MNPPTNNNELLIRIDEQLKSLSAKLDGFISTVKDGYVTKLEFESWKNADYSSVKQNVENSTKFKWILITSAVSGIGALVISLLK